MTMLLLGLTGGVGMGKSTASEFLVCRGIPVVDTDTLARDLAGPGSPVAREISNRLTRIFLPDKSGRRPVYGGTEKFQTDPYWKDYILFYEYFHGDNGAGLGASHQTGWTGTVAKLIEVFGRLDAAQFLAGGKAGAFAQKESTLNKRVA